MLCYNNNKKDEMPYFKLWQGGVMWQNFQNQIWFTGAQVPQFLDVRFGRIATGQGWVGMKLLNLISPCSFWILSLITSLHLSMTRTSAYSTFLRCSNEAIWFSLVLGYCLSLKSPISTFRSLNFELDHIPIVKSIG